MTMKVHRTIRYRLHPQTKGKADSLHEVCNACRYVWNHFVSKLRDDYIFYGECDPRFYTIGKQFTLLRRYQQAWLQKYSANIVKTSLKTLETCYSNFYNKQGGLPRFKGAYRDDPSFPIASGTFRLNGEYLHIQKVGEVKLSGKNPYKDSNLKSGTIKYEAGKWYAYLVFEVEQGAALPHAINSIGIDRNVNQITTSEGIKYETPRLERLEARKRRYQRMMSRRDCGSRKERRKPSNRYMQARQKFQKTSHAILHARTNWCHQVSHEISRDFDVAYLEDLNIKGMTKSAKGTVENPGANVAQKRGLNRSIRGSCWSKLNQCLGYKMVVEKVPAAYTSQSCNRCGSTRKDNRKTQASFHCMECGHRANADHNAALNILASGIGATGRGGGDNGRPVKRQNDMEVRTAD